MRVYEEIVSECGQLGAFLDRLDETDAQHWCLDDFDGFDETSDVEDPEAELQKERDSTRAFVQAAQDALAAAALRRDLERKSMELEDLRGHLLRK